MDRIFDEEYDELPPAFGDEGVPRGKNTDGEEPMGNIDTVILKSSTMKFIEVAKTFTPP